MTLIERLKAAGVATETGGDGVVLVRPADGHALQEVVRACRVEGGTAGFEVNGRPSAPPWCYGARRDAEEPRVDVRVDLACLRDVTLDSETHLVTAGAGIEVSELEATLGRIGFTLGFQESPAVALGAWLSDAEPGPGAARSFPGWSPVAGVEAVLLEGSLVRTGLAPRSATGPDPKALLVGGGGRLGIITRATLRVFPSARAKRTIAAFPDPGAAVGALVEALGRDMVPDAFGLIDGGDGEALLTWESRGEPKLVAAVMGTVEEICLQAGGRRIGSRVGRGDPDAAPDEPRDEGVLTGAAGPLEMRGAAASDASEGGEGFVAIGCGARWSRVLLVRRALLNEVGPGVRLHLERALPEAGLAIACVPRDGIEKARKAIRDAGGWVVGDGDDDSWLEGVAGALLGGKT